MATNAQILANRENSTHSTGPTSTTGKAASAQNALTFGLYTRNDFVEPHEREIYHEFCHTLFVQLAPANLLEEGLAADITTATWRLRRATNAEAKLAENAAIDPLLDEAAAQTIRSIERARASAQCALNRAVNLLRKLQTDRQTRENLEADCEDSGLADCAHVLKALHNQERCKQLHTKGRHLQNKEIDRQRAAHIAELASYCKNNLPDNEIDAAHDEADDQDDFDDLSEAA